MQNVQRAAMAAAVLGVIGVVAIPAVKNAQDTTSPNGAVNNTHARAPGKAQGMQRATSGSGELDSAGGRRVSSATGFASTPNDGSAVASANAPTYEAFDTSRPVDRSRSGLFKPQDTPLTFFGRDNPVTVAALPPSQLRTDLEALSPAKQTNALATLNKLHFSEAELDVVRVDRGGAVLYADPKFIPHPEVAASAEGAAYNANQLDTDPLTALPAGDIFQLHSRHGAAYTAYLDFTGMVFENNAWNELTGEPFHEAYPFDIDGDYTSFSAQEQAMMFSIWRQVSEDYAPFDIDITTERPLTFDDFTIHALITEPVDVAGKNMPFHWAGGVAYPDQWGKSSLSYYSPAITYHGGSPSTASIITSHEIGHLLGMSHDGTLTSSYYSGHGSGEMAWAPIMGGGYGANLTQWSRGDYAQSSNAEDDIDIIANGFGSNPYSVGYREEDHGDRWFYSTPLVVASGGGVNATTPTYDPSNMNPQNKGVIKSEGDSDMWEFVTQGGTVNFVVYPIDEGQYSGTNLDLSLELSDYFGNVIATSNPLTDTFAQIEATVGTGLYFLKVTGEGSQLAPFPAYGSLGQYFISGLVPGHAGPLVDTVPPAPNPVDWKTYPQAVSEDSITMLARTTYDASGVEYFFECVSGPNCASSSWQTSTYFSVGSLTPSTSYTFRVKARDGAGNETGWSPLAVVATDHPITDNCPNTVFSNGTMYNWNLNLATNACLTHGASCATYFEQSAAHETALCDGGTWIIDPSSTGSSGSSSGGSSTGGSSGSTPPPVTDNCPNSVFQNGTMYDSNTVLTNNDCLTAGTVCPSVYFYGPDVWDSAQCTTNGWLQENPAQAPASASGIFVTGGSNAPQVDINACPSSIDASGMIVNGDGDAAANICNAQGTLCSDVFFEDINNSANALCNGSTWEIDVASDECPLSIYDNGMMYDTSVTYTENQCGTAGTSCANVYVHSELAYTAVECNGSEWAKP